MVDVLLNSVMIALVLMLCAICKYITAFEYSLFYSMCSICMSCQDIRNDCDTYMHAGETAQEYVVLVDSQFNVLRLLSTIYISMEYKYNTLYLHLQSSRCSLLLPLHQQRDFVFLVICVVF